MKQFYKITNLLKALKNIHFSFTNSESRQPNKKQEKRSGKLEYWKSFHYFHYPIKFGISAYLEVISLKRWD